MCRYSHLLSAELVEILATEARGDKVATEGRNEGDSSHKTQQRADQIHQQRQRQLWEGPHGDPPGAAAPPPNQLTSKPGTIPEASAVRSAAPYSQSIPAPAGTKPNYDLTLPPDLQEDLRSNLGSAPLHLSIVSARILIAKELLPLKTKAPFLKRAPEPDEWWYFKLSFCSRGAASLEFWKRN